MTDRDKALYDQLGSIQTKQHKWGDTITVYELSVALRRYLAGDMQDVERS